MNHRTNRRLPATAINRRRFAAGVGAALATNGLQVKPQAAPAVAPGFQLKYMLASCMYGHIYLGDILPEVTRTGATAIDLWPRKHGSQREQLNAIGEETFLSMLADHGVGAGCLTRYDLSKANLQDALRDEIRTAGRLGCDTVVTMARGPKNLKGGELKVAIRNFIEEQRPTMALAEEQGVRLAIENHGNNLIDSPDSLKWWAEMTPSPSLAIAFAPYHLPQNKKLMADLIRALGSSIALFYAWEHGMGCMERLPKEQELMQLPGRGELDFRPLLAALKSIDFQGWTEIFMHPVPRGIPILESEALVTQEINVARTYLENQLKEI